MSDRDRLRDLPSVDRLATAVARAELQARREELHYRCGSTHRCSPPRGPARRAFGRAARPTRSGAIGAVEPTIRALRLLGAAGATPRQRADRPRYTAAARKASATMSATSRPSRAARSVRLVSVAADTGTDTMTAMSGLGACRVAPVLAKR
jgi:hypothetical protein